MAFTDTLEWPECNSDKATVGSVVCMVYTDGQPYKPCVLCETGFKPPLKNRQNIGLIDQLPLNAGQKYRRMLPLGAFCNTFDLH